MILFIHSCYISLTRTEEFFSNSNLQSFHSRYVSQILNKQFFSISNLQSFHSRTPLGPENAQLVLMSHSQAPVTVHRHRSHSAATPPPSHTTQQRFYSLRSCQRSCKHSPASLPVASLRLKNSFGAAPCNQAAHPRSANAHAHAISPLCELVSRSLIQLPQSAGAAVNATHGSPS